MLSLLYKLLANFLVEKVINQRVTWSNETLTLSLSFSHSFSMFLRCQSHRALYPFERVCNVPFEQRGSALLHANIKQIASTELVRVEQRTVSERVVRCNRSHGQTNLKRVWTCMKLGRKWRQIFTGCVSARICAIAVHARAKLANSLNEDTNEWYILQTILRALFCSYWSVVICLGTSKRGNEQADNLENSSQSFTLLTILLWFRGKLLQSITNYASCMLRCLLGFSEADCNCKPQGVVVVVFVAVELARERFASTSATRTTRRTWNLLLPVLPAHSSYQSHEPACDIHTHTMHTQCSSSSSSSTSSEVLYSDTSKKLLHLPALHAFTITASVIVVSLNSFGSTDSLLSTYWLECWRWLAESHNFLVAVAFQAADNNVPFIRPATC